MNILLTPPTAAQIDELRAAAQSNDKFEDSAGYKVLMFCPIPIVDVIAGMSTYAVESAMKPDLSAPFRYVPGSAAREWPGGTLAAEYVAKVRAQGRDLIESEVQALDRAESLESAVQLGVRAGVQALRGALDGTPLAGLLTKAPIAK